MEKITHIDKIHDFSLFRKKQKKIIGFVPTMGFLHEGHLSLVRAAKKECDIVIVSIYVNPHQFSPDEDFETYPRNIDRDFSLLEKEEVDAVFIPKNKDIYPEGYISYMSLKGQISNLLCGKSRPGHFDGVSTILTKLFNIISPDKVYFGQKDAQQSIVIKRLISDLNFNIEIRVMPIIREEDGLAMSSRNVYLSKEERVRALSLYKALTISKECFLVENMNFNDIRKKMIEILKDVDTIEYLEIRDASNLNVVNESTEKILIAVCVIIGKTRLIDNIVIDIT